MMKHRLTLTIVLLLLSATALAQNVTQVVQQAPSNSAFELFNNWQSIAVIALVISVVLVGIGYMVGIGFDLPEMQAWARSELGQVFANAIIIIALIGFVALLDVATMSMVNASGIGGLHCSPGENCLNKTANAYLGDYIGLAQDGAKNVLQQDLVATAWANRRFGIYCYSLWCGEAGVSWSLWANYILDADRYGIVFEYYQGVLSSLYSQVFFVSEICFKVAPLLLALGIVARSFFVTRKVGGLLIAIAVAVMFFFPAMYIFDWMSLDMTITGDTSSSLPAICPAECSYTPPIAYYDQGSSFVALNTTTQVYAMFDDSQTDAVRDLILGTTHSMLTDSGTNVTSCENWTVHITDPSCGGNGQCDVACDPSCRELPYPASSSFCANYTQQLACAELPAECKVTRIVADINTTEEAVCPTECKMVPPLRSDCDLDATNNSQPGGDCLQSRFDCRVAEVSDLNWRPSVSPTVANASLCNTYPKDCIASLDANDSCVWVMPQFGSCDDLCTGCPEECRISNGTSNTSGILPEYCSNDSEDGPACQQCPDTCKVPLESIEAKAPTDGTNCTSCPETMRIYGTNLPASYLEDFDLFGFHEDCSPTSCPLDYRVQVPYSSCDSCADSQESYTYNPPIDTECTNLCAPSDSGPSKTSGDYTQIGAEGMVGTQDIQSVAKFMGPAYLLPLLNIVATLIVIKSLSEMLGGDVEIPGMSRIF
jgi:hypothetical protein